MLSARFKDFLHTNEYLKSETIVAGQSSRAVFVYICMIYRGNPIKQEMNNLTIAGNGIGEVYSNIITSPSID